MTSDRKKICKVISFILVAVLVFSSLFAYLFYLDLKKTFIARLSGKASSLVGQQINIGDISFSLSSGINIYDIQIQNPQRFVPGQLLKIKKISLNMNYRELFEGKLYFGNIDLYSPVLTIMKDREGKLNIGDEFRRFLLKKGTLTYEVDEFRILSGMAGFNNDVRYRGDRINLVLKNLSSRPGAKTFMTGDAMLSGENRVEIAGSVNLRDEPKKFRISLSAEDFKLSPFKMILEKYQVDAEKTRVSMTLDAGGDTDTGINLTSRIKIKSPGYDIYKKALLNINIDASIFYDIAAHAATINTLSVRVGDASALKLRGRLMNLQKNPSYDLALKLESLDLSAFNIARGFRMSGMLISDTINMKGRFDNSFPEVSGSVQLKEASVKSDTADVRNMNVRMTFTSGEEISARAEASAEILNAGGHFLSRPVDVRLSMNAKKQRGAVALSASMSASPIDMEIGQEKKLSLGNVRVVMDGMLKGKAFSGKSTINGTGLRCNDYSFNRLECGLEFNYGQGNITIKNPRLETEDFSSSADLLKIRTTGKKGVLLIGAINLGAALPMKKVELKGLDFSVSLHSADKDLSGEFGFSAAEVMFQKIKSGKVAGSGKFNGNDFFLEIPHADVSGGRIRLIAQGKTSQGPFPVKAEVTAEHIALGGISGAIEKYSGADYQISGDIERFAFKGTMDSRESVHGVMAIDLQKLSVVSKKTSRHLLKDALIQSDIALQGRDCEFKVTASAGNVTTTVSAAVQGFLGDERSVRMHGHLKGTPVTEIRNSFWDIFPDALLYAGMDGSVSSDMRLNYNRNGVSVSGDLMLKDFNLDGENGEYSAGPVNGVIPFAYGAFENRGKPLELPSFERSEFDRVSRFYADAYRSDDYDNITIGSLQYGFRLIEDVNVWMKQDGGILNVGRFSANIFGGRMNGSAVVDISDGFHYRAGMLLEGLSLTKLCDDIGPIKGYISGKVDGIGTFKGYGAGLPQLIGRSDFWTYSTKDEKTKISREFLQKIGGPSIKSYLGDRNFNKGVMSLYIQKGFLIFRELEIANRNFLGIQDLSVKVAPFNNRIAIDHLMWTIVEAANRAKKDSE